jgi:hypothetical protein
MAVIAEGCGMGFVRIFGSLDKMDGYNDCLDVFQNYY